MPDFLVFIAIILSLIITLVLLGPGLVDNYDPLFILPVTIFIISLSWFIYYCNEPWKTDKSITIEVKTVDGIDIAVFEDKIYNLNEIYNRDFEEGTEVYIHDLNMEKYLGILPSGEEFRLSLKKEGFE